MSAFDRFGRDELAALCREYLLDGHLIDRAGMPHVVAEFGLDTMRDVAIDEWMGASPVYTRRIQRLLGFEGDDVATIFKGMQFDIGAPHQFMDFRYRVDSATHGEFWLAHCGALMDVEPMGDDFVVAMCHHIEDPTFDATAMATNPRARMRPIHRPPRTPADRHPHCHWTVDIEPGAEPLVEPAVTEWMTASRAAAVAVETPPSVTANDDEGATDYAGELDPDLKLERFSRATLLALLDEVALQGHLLARSFMLAVRARAGDEAASRIGAKQLIGIAGLTARRLARHFDLAGGTGSIAEMLRLHPMAHPGAYVDLDVEQRGDEVLVVLRPSPAMDEGDGFTWPALLVGDAGTAVLAAAANGVDARARVERASAPPPDAVAAWSITVDPSAEPAPEASEVTLAAFSTGADFVLQ